MIGKDKYGLPRELDNGLILRWATSGDAEELAHFNLALHSDNPDEPFMGLYYWTLDLMRGVHPTTKASDFTVVVDTNANDRIVSSLNLISQTWAYEGIPFGVGRPELVATLPEYRRRGLVRAQMEAIHTLSASRGELVTAITGIPWYYRQFGYEMGLNLGGSRQLFWARPGNDKPVEHELYRIRLATTEDIPLMHELYRGHLGQSPVVRLRDDAAWRYEMADAHTESLAYIMPRLIETLDGRVVGYVIWYERGTSFSITEFGVLSGHSWRAIGRFVIRHLRQEANVLNENRELKKQLTNISFRLGDDHPLYDALGPDLERQIRPYAWYIRVPDIPSFLRHITPVLEKRLARSVVAGHTGKMKINLYRSRFVLDWQSGRLSEISDNYEQTNIEDGDAHFPELTFLQLLFGYSSIDELTLAYADLYTESNDALVLLRALFPKRSSIVLPME